jgi:hypothetical protein
MAVRDKTPTLSEKIRGDMSESGTKTRKETPLVWVKPSAARVKIAGQAVTVLSGTLR